MAESIEPPAPTSSADALRTVQAELAAWGHAHPQATFAEIEAAVEQHLGRLRAALIDERLPNEPDGPEGERPRCPACGGALVARGRRRRRLRVLGDEPVTLERVYWTCPQCGGGLFPPG
jgi:YgiT-type zinc finger domain-containing protein